MRLRDSLKGQARETVKALLSNSSNVSAIIQMLEETFGRPEQLIKNQISNVRKLNPVTEGDMDSLVIFANKVINMQTFLRNAHGEHHLSNPTLLSELVSKLPFNRRVQWAEKCLTLNGPANVSDFSEWLHVIRKLANMVIDSCPIEETTTQRSKIFKKCNYATVQIQLCRICEGGCKSLEECNKFVNWSTQERVDAVKQLRLCFCCLKGGHRVSKCFKRMACTHCGEKHHSLLHLNKSGPNGNLEMRNCHVDGVSSSVVFQVVPVHLYANNRKVTTYAFVDDGANATIIDKEIATMLGIKGKTDSLHIQWLNQQTSREQCENIQIEISGTHEDADIYKISNVYTSRNLSLPVQSLDANTVNEHCHLKHIPYIPYSSVKPRLIISLTHAYLTTPLQTPLTTKESGLIAIKTRLGWIV
ncbi:uncharacterized protein LOC142224935 [Haematobia irritans]|uniref:uncharacterized protein LOC142224935 n=1 Tax=Haematobia irritans TaxID=7368 RepID=UPI003F5036EA